MHIQAANIRTKVRALSKISNKFRIMDLPESNVVVFALLLNYPWELLQAPLFWGMRSATHWDAVKLCSRAVLGDAVIMLLAYWGGALVARDRWWIKRPRCAPILTMLAIGLAITVLVELLAIASNNPSWGWRYAEIMPVVPEIGIGLVPLVQWIILPLLLIWFVKRQLNGAATQEG